MKRLNLNALINNNLMKTNITLIVIFLHGLSENEKE